MSRLKRVDWREGDFESLPELDASLLDDADRQRCESLRLALFAKRSGATAAQLESQFGIKRQLIDYYWRRLFAQHPDGRPNGFRALLKYKVRKPYERKKALTLDCALDGEGSAGAFLKLLDDHPAAKTWIDRYVKRTRREDALNVAITYRVMHGEFLDVLRKEGLSPHDYPLCLKTQGYYALRGYVIEMVRTSKSAAASVNLFGKHALDKQDMHSGVTSWLRPTYPGCICCYDEYAIPAICSVVFTHDGERFVIPIERLSLCLLVCEDPEAIVAYHISMRRRVSASDLLETFDRMLTPWQPRRAEDADNIALPYKLGGGLPNGVISGFLRHFRIALLRLDNDLTHYANAILEFARARLGLNVQFGQVRRWISRAAVERIFSELQVQITRLASATGSGPEDRKVGSAVEEAIRHEITIEDLRMILDCLIADLNAKPRAQLYGATAMEALTRAFTSVAASPAICGYEPDVTSQLPFPTDIVRVIVRANEKHNRRPYVEMDDATYTSDVLRDAWHLKGKPMIALLQKDHRVMKLCHLGDMSPWGTVTASGQWGMSYHDRDTRLEILALREEGLLDWASGEDPVRVWAGQKAKMIRQVAAERPGRIVRGTNKTIETFVSTIQRGGSRSRESQTKLPAVTGKWMPR